MNPIRKILLAIGLVKRKPMVLRINGWIGIIQPTKVALDNNTIDKFNKTIVIREGVKVEGDKIILGKILKDIPYSEEVIKSIEQVYKIPIVERKYDSKIDFYQEPDFGSVENLI